MIVSDNGAERTSNAVLAWTGDAGGEWLYVGPVSGPRMGESKASMAGRNELPKDALAFTIVRPARSSRAGLMSATPSGRIPHSDMLPRRRSSLKSHSTGPGNPARCFTGAHAR